MPRLCTQRRRASGACCDRGSTSREGGVTRLGHFAACMPCHACRPCLRLLVTPACDPAGQAAWHYSPGRGMSGRTSRTVRCLPADAMRPPPKSACLFASPARCQRGRWPRREWMGSRGLGRGPCYGLLHLDYRLPAPKRLTGSAPCCCAVMQPEAKLCAASMGVPQQEGHRAGPPPLRV